MKLHLPTKARRYRRLTALGIALGAYVTVVAVTLREPPVTPLDKPAAVEIRDGWLYRHNEKLLLKAVGWDPARPGELPWERRRSRGLVRQDLHAIRSAGFNAIRTWELLAPEELAAAEAEGLMVLQGIWLDPAGRFASSEFRHEAAEKLRWAVRATRDSGAVVLYLIMNEPAPAAVLREGVGAAQSLFRELRTIAYAEGARAPVTFANWPGAEFVDDSSLDVVAANLYPFRPRTLLNMIGYAGMVKLWKQEQAGGRPLIVSEFGISVSPNGDPRSQEAPGGLSEEEQAGMLPQLADAIFRTGAAGAALFMWNDGWWKNAEDAGDELTHDSGDGEEWFGLHAFSDVGADFGRPRPALAAMRRWNRAVLTQPTDGVAATRELAVEMHSDEPGISVQVSIDGQNRSTIPLQIEGRWLRGRLLLPGDSEGIHRLRFTIAGSDGPIGTAERYVVTPGHGLYLRMTSHGEGMHRTLLIEASTDRGVPAVGISVRLAIVDGSHRDDRQMVLRTDARGQARTTVQVPRDEKIVLMAVAAVPGPEGAPPLALARGFLYSDALRQSSVR